MQYRENGTRYSDYSLWESKKYEAYDYGRNGLLKHIISHKIVESKNPILQSLLVYYEKSLIFVLKYIDRLRHFKNYHAKNR